MCGVRASAELELPGGERVVVVHGDLIGRLDKAAVFLDDPRVSEAHAMVSLRGGQLVLLSLRRLVAVNGQPMREVPLCAGLELGFADGLIVKVVRVDVPERVLGLQAEGLGVRLLAAVASVVRHPTGPRVLSRFVPEAAAHLWWSGDVWKLRVAEADAVVVEAGHAFRVDDVSFTLVALPTTGPVLATRAEGAIGEPLRIIASWDVAEIVRAGHPSVLLGGLAARIVSELVSLGGSAHWLTVAGEVWKGDDAGPDLRPRWDVALNRLRKKLRAAGIRQDLVSMDGVGQVVLSLGEADEVEDRT